MLQRWWVNLCRAASGANKLVDRRLVLGAVGLSDISQWIDYALFIRLLSRRFSFVYQRVKKPPAWSVLADRSTMTLESRSIRENTRAASAKSRIEQSKRQECPVVRKLEEMMNKYDLRRKGLFHDSENVKKKWLRSAFGVFRDKVVWDRGTRYKVYERDSVHKRERIASKKK